MQLDVNVPYAESPFLEADLAQRSDLGGEELDLLRRFARDGYVVLPGFAAADLTARIVNEVRDLFDPAVEEGPTCYYKRQDAWQVSPAVRELALHPAALATLRLLYRREPAPFQTLNFLYGTQSANHSDAILFNSFPAGYMCGVWVALEDVGPDTGPLFFYPGSHRLRQYYPEDLNVSAASLDEFFRRDYHAYIDLLMKQSGFERHEFHAKRGDALIWASNLVHGGMPRLAPERTRRSQVTHYFFSDCVHYVPLYSRPLAGEFFLRDVLDFTTRQPLPQTYNGQAFAKIQVAPGRWRLTFDAQAEPGSDGQEISRLAPLAGDGELALLVHAAERGEGPVSSVKFHLDLFQELDAQLTVGGWAFRTDAPTMEASLVQLIFAAPGRVSSADCRRHARHDLAAAYGPGYEKAGFTVTCDKAALAPGTYRLGLAVKQLDEPPAFTFIDRTLDVA